MSEMVYPQGRTNFHKAMKNAVRLKEGLSSYFLGRFNIHGMTGDRRQDYLTDITLRIVIGERISNVRFRYKMTGYGVCWFAGL
jgi:hypothetical protein